MVYVDESGNQIENPDLSLGYLVDAEWVDHPAQVQEGHYKYVETETGGKVQTFVVDKPAASAWREVTVQRYVLYTEAELEAIAREDYSARLDVLEAQTQSHSELLTAIEEGIADA